MPDGPVMYSFWVRNEATGEATSFLGQGATLSAAFKDGWDNANEDYRKKSDGGMCSRAHLAVRLISGEIMFRTPAKFQTRQKYAPAEEGKEFKA